MFLPLRGVPPAIREKLHGYHDLLFQINHGFDLQQIAGIFPRNVQEDTFFFMYEHVIRQVPMFAVTDNNFIRALVRMLKPQVLLAGDCAFRHGGTKNEKWFTAADSDPGYEYLFEVSTDGTEKWQRDMPGGSA